MLPEGARTRIARLDTFDGPVDEAFAPMSVTALLEDDLDIARGDMLCAADAPAQVARDLRADVCWLDETAARPGARYLVKHTTRTTRAELTRIEHRVDVGSLRTRARPGHARAQRHRPRSRCAPPRRWRSTATPTTARPAASS